jgi:hypothetical protein
MAAFGDLATRAGACAALAYDRDRLLEALAREEAVPGSVAIRHDPLAPAGRGPISVPDLVQHVAMWDEIVLAILSEARHGRAHWSLDPQWAPVEAGRALNVGGVEAGRLLPAELVVHRFRSVREALIAAIDEVPDEEWAGGLSFRHDGEEPQTLSGLCHYASTPEADPTRTRTYRHACVHLGIDAG